MKSIPKAIAGRSLLAAALLVPIQGCHDDSTSEIDLAPFKTMAASADCDDLRNRLYLIDDASVFWDREGSCADMLYTFALFGSTPDEILCERHDAIGGGNVTNCTDESYRAMFETIITNLNEPGLGLGTGHTVELVPF